VVASALADVAVIVVFVLVGRASHAEGETLGGVLGVMAPFLLALTAAWVAGGVWRRPRGLRTGLTVWAATWLGGMALRRVVFTRSTALAFVIVGGVFLGLGLLGWRWVTSLVTARRARPAAVAARPGGD